MKHFLLSLAFLIALAVPGFAETVTVDFSTKGYSNAAAVTTVTTGDDNISMVFDKGSGSSAPAYYTSGTSVRTYANNTLTIAAAGDNKDNVTIKSIAFTYSQGAYTGNDIANNTWTGTEKSVVFTTGSSQVRIQKIVITYEITGGGEDTRVKPTMSWSAEAVELTEGDVFTAPELTVDPIDALSVVTYSSENEAVATVDETGTVTIAGVGETKITATIAADDTYKAASASYTITVKKAIVAGEDQTATIVFSTLGYSNAQVISDVTFDAGKLTFAKGSGSSDPAYYNTGTGARAYNGNTLTFAGDNGVTITKIEFTFSGTYTMGSATADTGTYNNGTWTGEANKVTITSKATSRIQTITITYSVDGGGNDDLVTPSLKWSEEAVELTLGDEFTAPTLTVEPAEAISAVTYASDNTEVATIDAEGKVTIVGVGTAKITAAIAADDTYNKASASYTITVKKAAVAGQEQTATIVFSELSYGNGDKVTDVEFADGKVTFAQETGSNPPAYYTTGSGARTYDGNTITFAGNEDVTITKIEFIFDGTNTLGSATADNGTYNNGTWTGEANKVTITSKGKSRIQKINITYNIEVADPNKTTPVLTWSETAVTVLQGDEFTAPTLTATPTEAQALVTYSSSNEAVATVDAEGKITLTGATGDAKITAAIAADATYNKASAACTISVKAAATTVKEALAVADNEKVILNFPLTVAYTNGTHMFAADAAGDWMWIYGSDLTGDNGDVIAAGWEATKTPYGELSEFKPTSTLGEITPAGAEPLAFAEVEAIDAALTYKGVTFKNVEISTLPAETANSFTVTAAGVEYTIYNQFRIAHPTVPGTYSIKGIVGSYNGNLQFWPIDYTLLSVGKIQPSYSFAQKEVTGYTEDEQMDIPALIGVPEDLEVIYESSNENVAIADDVIILFGDPGTAVITAYNEATDKYEAHATTFTLTLLAEKPELPVEATFTFTTPVEGQVYGITPTSDSNSFVKDPFSATEGVVEMAIKVVDPTSNGYRIWTKSSKYDLRIYKGTELTLSTTDPHYVITNIEFAKSSIAANINLTGVTNYAWSSATGVESVTFPVTGTTNLDGIKVTCIKRAVPDFEADFSHDLYLDEEEEAFYNKFDVTFMLGDNGVGADHYTLSFEGKVIDNNIELDEDGMAMVDIEYIPYRSVYDLTLTAINAEGDAMGNYTFHVAHALDIENAVPVELDQKYYIENDLPDGDIDVHFRVYFDIDAADAGYEYYFAAANGHPNIAFETYIEDGVTYRNMLYWGFTNGTKNGSVVEINTDNLPVLDPQVYTVFPMAHKELVVINEPAGARRKVASQAEVVKTTPASAPMSEPIEVTASTDDVLTGVEGISADTAADVEYYNLQGVRIAEPAAGLYIRRQGSRTSKVVIR